MKVLSQWAHMWSSQMVSHHSRMMVVMYQWAAHARAPPRPSAPRSHTARPSEGGGARATAEVRRPRFDGRGSTAGVSPRGSAQRSGRSEAETLVAVAKNPEPAKRVGKPLAIRHTARWNPHDAFFFSRRRTSPRRYFSPIRAADWLWPLPGSGRRSRVSPPLQKTRGPRSELDIP